MDHRRALSQRINGFRPSQAVYVAARLGVADLLREGPKSSAALAEAVSADPRSLYRLLRYLCSLGVFAEAEPDRFVLTPEGTLLTTDAPGSLRAAAMWFVEYEGTAWNQLLGAVRTGGVAFDSAFGAPLFDYVVTHPEAGALFDATMSAQTGAGWAAAVVEAYDFSASRLVIDVGGGRGALLASILQASPKSRGVLFDLPSVVSGSKTVLTDAGVADRCEVVGGNFFESVPEGGDTYVMKAIVHDWDDERAVAILRNCRRAMPRDARLLLVERVMPEGTAMPSPEWLAATGPDVNMMVCAGGRERTRVELASLLEDAGLILSKILPTTAPYSVIEAAVGQAAGDRTQYRS